MMRNLLYCTIVVSLTTLSCTAKLDKTNETEAAPAISEDAQSPAAD